MDIFGDDFLKDMFDFNDDGKLDFSERLYRDAFFVNELLQDEEKQKINKDNCFCETNVD